MPSEDCKIYFNSIGVLDGWFDRNYMDDLTQRIERKYNQQVEKVDRDSDWGPGFEHIDGVTFQKNAKRWDQSFEMRQFGSFQQDAKKIRHRLDEGADLYWQQLYEASGHTELQERAQRSVDPTLKVQRTPPGGGFNVPHFEQGGGEGICNRHAVWMLYLNDVPNGGMTSFPVQGLDLQPKAGTMVIWPAAYTHLHHGNPPIDCWKYVITGWYTYHNLPQEDPEQSEYG